MKDRRFQTAQVLFLAIFTLSALYIAATRLTNFFSFSRSEKIITVITIALSSFPITILMSRRYFSITPAGIPFSKWITILLFFAIISAGINIFLLPPVPFPESQTVQIIPLPEHENEKLVLISIEELNTRSQARTPVSEDFLELDDGWEIDPLSGEITWSGIVSTAFIYRNFTQSGLRIRFKTGPDGGKAQIVWDDREQLIDLFSLANSSIAKDFAPAYNLRSASSSQKILVCAAYLARWMLLTGIFVGLFSVLTRMPGERTKTILITGIVLIALLPLVSLANPIVSFPDPALETAVREVLDNPYGPIRQQKLLTIAGLDLAESGIYDLDGIQYISNLNNLSLRDNHITDISPLVDLKALKDLNLRGNGIENITPITSLTALENLNLRDNPVRDLGPLESLKELHTLNLQAIPVGKLDFLENFPRLTRLNLRNCGISDVRVLVKLMQDGLLQDDPLRLVHAELDIRENPIPWKEYDGYAPLRHYWENIYDRAPFVLPAFAQIDPPVFSHPAGFYEDGFSITFEADHPQAVIYYTLGGSVPGLDSPKYKNPIEITESSGNDENLSLVTTTSPQWEPPAGSVFKATVVRAIAVLPNGARSAIATATFFIAPEMDNRYTLPVVSLTADPSHLFSPEQGIYVVGRALENYDGKIDYREANYYQRGGQWERPVHVEFFTPSGESLFAQDAGMRIHGASIRHYPQKSLRLYADDRYGSEDFFTINAFPDQNIASNMIDDPVQFKNLVLRNTGNNRSYPHFRDALMHFLLADSTVDTAAYQPVNVFLNGEYWGIHAMREHLNEYFIAAHYSLPLEDIAILERNAQLYFGTDKDQADYLDLLRYIRENDISQPEVYAAVAERMDINNYLDYTIAEIFSANKNWPHDNIKYWRYRTDSFHPDGPRGLDGRWRWMLFDLDNAFGYGGEGFGYDSDSIAQAEGEFLFRSLLLNPQFKRAFINRVADMLNTAFRPDNVLSVINTLNEELRPDLPEYFNRWNLVNGDIELWEDNVDIAREFAAERPDHLRGLIQERFQLEGTTELTVITDPDCGYVRLNSINISKDTPGISDPAHWTGIYFTGIPLTITAIPHEGCLFQGWQGVEAAESTVTLVLDGSLSIQPVFTPVQ